MGIVSYTFSEANGGHPIKSRSSGANAKTRLRILGDKLLITVAISLLTMQYPVSEVAGQALPPTEAPAQNGLAPGPQQSSPPLSPPLAQPVQFQQVLSSLRSNNFTTGAQYISDYLFLLPLGSTVFVPTNAAFDGMNQYLNLGPLLAYHAVLQQLSYEQMLLLPVGTRFPSFIGNNNTVVITFVALNDFSVDDVRVVQANICSSATSALQISCHGVGGILNMTLWGRTDINPVAPGPSPESEAPIPELAPPPVIFPQAVGSLSAPTPAPEASPPAGGACRAESRCTLLSMVFLYVFAAAITI